METMDQYWSKRPVCNENATAGALCPAYQRLSEPDMQVRHGVE